MWPWLLILAGTLLIVGALIARRRILRDSRAGLARTSREAVADDVAGPDVVDRPPTVTPPTVQIRPVPADAVPIFVVTASEPSTRTIAESARTERLGPERPSPEPIRPPRPAFARVSTPPLPTAPEPTPTPAPPTPPAPPPTS